MAWCEKFMTAPYYISLPINYLRYRKTKNIWFQELINYCQSKKADSSRLSLLSNMLERVASNLI